MSDLWLWALLALIPALLASLGSQRLAPRRFAALIVPAIVVAIGAATGHWPFRPTCSATPGYFRLVGGDLHDGLDRWVRTLLPYDPVKAAQLHAVVVLAIFACFAALAAALLVWRSPYPAIVVGFIPFLVVSTVYVLPRPTLRAAIFLALMLAILGVLSQRRRPTIQLAAGATVVLVAVLAATLPGVAKSAMLDWKQWGKPEKTGTSVGFIWNHSYAGLKRPKRPVTLLRVTADSPSYWRAVVLSNFNGVAWVSEPTVVETSPPPNAVVPQDALSATAQGLSLKQKAVKFQNVNLATTNLVAPSEVLAIKGVDGDAGVISRTSDGVFQTDKNVPVDSELDGRVPAGAALDQGPHGVARRLPGGAAVDLAVAARRQRPVPGLGHAGARGRGRRPAQPGLLRSAAGALARGLRQGARADPERGVTDEAVAAIESYFQSNYRYDEKADYSQAADGPLPSFFLDGKRGYCQMYAGTMTVILRMLGIPARVGEGFTEGTRNVSRGTYVVTDRDAHAWVEVWFPKYGWMAFEPTPSRELPFNYSTTSKDFSEAAQSALAGVAGFDSARLEQLAKLAGTPSRVAGAPLGGGRGPREGGGEGVGAVVGREWHPGFVSWLLLLAAGVVALLVLAKRLRSVIPYLRKGPHAIAGAVRRDLEAFVRDQGVPDAVVTLTPRSSPACCAASSASTRPAGRACSRGRGTARTTRGPTRRRVARAARRGR